MHPFDEFFEEHGYKDGEEPQAFADWLASIRDEPQLGIRADGEAVVVGFPGAKP